MTIYRTNFDRTKPFSDLNAVIELNTNVNLTWAVPGDSSVVYRALFSFNYTVDFWVALNQTAVVPTLGVAASVPFQQHNPVEPLYVKGGDVLNFITSVGTPQIGVSLLAIPNT